MKYFQNIKTLEDLKKQYYKLAKELHPDMGGDAKKFKAMKNEYDSLFASAKDYHYNRSGEAYYKETSETVNHFTEIIEKLLKLKNIKIEIIGTFVWVSGNTKQHKEELKKLGFKYSSKKRNWYLSPPNYKRFGNKTYSMKAIRAMYGVQGEYESKKQMAIQGA